MGKAGLTDSPGLGILEGQSLALQTMSSSHKIMFSRCFKVNWRASGRLSLLTLGCFPVIFCFKESGKSVSPQILDVSDSLGYFLGVLHNPNSKIYRSIR